MPHSWTFFRSGGFDQVALRSSEDLRHLKHLDQKLWAALSCPVKGLEFDERTLALIDKDGDGRVRVNELLDAVAWADARLTDLGLVLAGEESLAVAAIRDGDDEGRALRACVARVLEKAGRAGADRVSLADIVAAAGNLTQTEFNGDGIVPAESVADPVVRQVALDIIATTGGALDRNGQQGVSAELLAAFWTEAEAFAAWAGRAETEPDLFPLGDATPAAAAAMAAVKAKVEDYFARCRLAAYDARAEAALNRREEDFLAMAAHDLTVEADEIRAFPLALIGADRPLPLDSGINPAWTDAIAAFVHAAVEPLVGARSALSSGEWSAIRGRLEPHRAWQGAKAGARVEGLGLARVREILAGPGRDGLTALIEADKAVAPEFAALEPLEKLVRLNRDLFRLLHNFVNFADFYSPDRLAVFQAGTLYIDSRACELCVRVDDAGKHAALAGLAKTYLAYCDCTRRGSADKMTICVAITNGDSDNLMVGRNGVFYDRKGQDWDATITKVVESPISVRQAFWSPYKKLIRFVEEMIAKRASGADDASHAKLQGAATTAVTAAETGKPPPKPKFEVGTVAALGVGIGAIGTIIGGAITGFVNLGWWMPLGALGILLGISGPSMVIAALKLRIRNLGPILDANGWAVNGRVRINIPFGAKLTELAVLPAGSVRSLSDPYADKRSHWKLWLVLAAILALAGWLGWDRIRHGQWYWDPRADGSYRWQEPVPAAPSATAAPVAVAPH